MQSNYIYCVMWEKTTTSKTNYFEENPEKIINEWAAVFGPENIIVRPYEKQQNAPDIFHDFFRAVGLPFSEEYELPAKPANIRTPDKFVEIKRNINLLFPDKAVQNRFLEIIREMAKKLPEEDVYAAHGYLSPKKRLDVLERSAAWNASIAEKYLCRSDGRLFYDPLPDPNEHWRPFGGLEAGEAISLTASIFARFIEKTEASTHENIARLEHASEQMKQPEATPRAKIAELQRSIDSYAERMHQQALRSSEQAACLQGLYNSYSWKLTAPLRAIAGFFRRSKNPSL
jgi:hypothetical protein